MVTKLVQQFIKEIVRFVGLLVKSFVKLFISFILAEHNLLIRVIQLWLLVLTIVVLNYFEFKIFIDLSIKLNQKLVE